MAGGAWSTTNQEVRRIWPQTLVSGAFHEITLVGQGLLPHATIELEKDDGSDDQIFLVKFIYVKDVRSIYLRTDDVLVDLAPGNYTLRVRNPGHPAGHPAPTCDQIVRVD